MKAGSTHAARKQLFQRGIQRGWLALAEIDAALPPGTLSPSERWLLFYSLRAAEVEIRGVAPGSEEGLSGAAAGDPG